MEPTTATKNGKIMDGVWARTENLARWFEMNGVPDRQTAWELAVDIEPLVRRLIEGNYILDSRDGLT